jgi:cell division septation protein DedD
MHEAPKRMNGFLGFVKNFILFLLLMGVVVASFWVSFLLGRRILVPVKKIPERKIDIVIPEPPPSVAALQNLEEVMGAELEKAEAPRLTIAEAKPKLVAEPKVIKSQSGIHYYKVVAGLYADKDRATALVQDLNANGFGTYLKEMNAGWRVQVGAFKDKVRAQHLLQSLKIKGFDSKIVYE